MNSRRKGKDGELEAARALREHLGLPVTRAAQHSGKEQADLRGVPGLHFEVKRRRRIGAIGFLDQARDESGTGGELWARSSRGGDVPVVLMRQDGDDWVIMLGLRDLERFIQRLSASRTL